MSDGFFDADRAAGLYPPKGWGWKYKAEQREILKAHFAKPNAVIDKWMIDEAEVLGVALPDREHQEPK